MVPHDRSMPRAATAIASASRTPLFGHDMAVMNRVTAPRIILLTLECVCAAQVGMIVTDGDAVKVSYAHNIDPTQTFGGEAIKNLSKETTTFTLAYAKKLHDSSLFKARLSNNGGALHCAARMPLDKSETAKQLLSRRGRLGPNGVNWHSLLCSCPATLSISLRALASSKRWDVMPA